MIKKIWNYIKSFFVSDLKNNRCMETFKKWRAEQTKTTDIELDK